MIGDDQTLDGPKIPGSSASLDPRQTVAGLANPAITASPILYAPKIDGYQITGRLGEGGMGVVWKAIQLSTKREVALKLMSAAGFGSDNARSRFEREVELTAKLDHSNIARIFDSGLRQGVFFYAMELIQGQELDEFIKAKGLPRLQIVQLMQRVCRAVQHAHQKGVIHRDLKPSNILITPDGEPHVLDFGLAKALEGGQQLSLDGDVAGTPVYMSPEQAAGRLDTLDTRSDVYTLGVILFHLLSGRYPHEPTGSAMATMKRIAEEEPKRLGAIEPRADRELEAILIKTLSKEPERRYASAAGLADDLGRYLRHEPLVAQPPTLSYLLRKNVRRHRLPIGIASGVLIVLLGMAVWAYARVTKEKNAALAANVEKEKQRQIAGAERLEALEQKKIAIANAAAAKASAAKAEASKKTAVASEAKAQASEKAAIAAQSNAELQLTTALVGQGDILGAAQRWDEAKSAFEKAKDLLRKLNRSTTSAELGLWNAFASSPLPLNDWGTRGTAVSVAALPDGRLAVILSDKGYLQVFDLVTGSVVRELELETPKNGRWKTMAMVDNGKTAVCESANALWLVDVQSAKVTGSIALPERNSNADTHISLSPDKKSVALISLPNDLFEICELQNGHRTTLKAIHVATSIVWSPDGKWLVMGGIYGESAIFSASNGKQVQKFSAHRGKVTALAISPDSRLLASADELGNLKIWDLLQARELHSVRAHRAAVRALSFSADGSGLFSSGDDGSIMLWDSESLKMKQFVGQARGRVAGLAFTMDGKALISIGGAVQVWTLSPSRESITLQSFSTQRSHVEFSPNGTILLTTGSPDRVRTYEPITGLQLTTVSAGQLATFLPDGVHFAAYGHHDQLELWESSSLTQVRAENLKLGDLHGITALGHGDEVALSLGSRGIYCFDVASGRKTRTICTTRPSNDGDEALAASPDGTKILAPLGHDVCVWNTNETDKPTKLGSLAGHVRCVAWSRDGKLIASGSDRASRDKTADIKIWDMTSQQLVRVIDHQPFDIRAIAISADSQLLIVGMDDGSVAICDARGDQSPRTIGTHDAPIHSVAFSPDGLRAASSAEDGTVRLWDFSPQEQMRHPELWADAWSQLRKNPDNPAAMAKIGQWYAFRGKWDWALDLLTKARDGGENVSSLTLGRCYWQLENYPAASREFQKAGERHEAPESAVAIWVRALQREIVRQPEWIARKKTVAGLVADEKYEAAIEEYTKLLTIIPTDPELRSLRSSLLVHAGKLREAAEDEEAAMEIDGGNHRHLFRAAPLRLYLGDRDAYLRDSQLMFDRFAVSTSRSDVTERTIKIALLDPINHEDVAVIEKLCDAVLAHNDGPVANMPYFEMSKGLAEYRAGRFKEASERLAHCRGKLARDEGNLTTEFLIAMAQYKLGRAVEAKASLAAAERRLNAAGCTPEIVGGWGYQEWFILQIIRREAEGLILGALPTTGPSTQPTSRSSSN